MIYDLETIIYSPDSPHRDIFEPFIKMRDVNAKVET